MNLQALSSSLSDHSPLFLCSQQQVPRWAHFRFEHFWIRVPGFQDVVASAWSSPVRGTSPLIVFHNRLTATARSLRSWSRTLFSEARTQLLMANDNILRLDVAQESRTLSAHELDLRKELKVRVLGWAAVERSRRRQSSSIQIKEGDACTKFFRRKAASRRKKNLIAYLKSDNGEIVWNHSEKEDILSSYFTNILGTRTNRSCSLD